MKKIFSNRTNFFVSLFSISLIIIGLTCGFINLSVKSQLLEVMTGCGLTLWVLPFLVAQSTFIAGVDGFVLNPSDFRPATKWLVYLTMFPFINLYAFVCFNSLFKFYPPCQGLIRYDYLAEIITCAAVMYATLIIAGLVWRYLRKVKSRKVIA